MPATVYLTAETYASHPVAMLNGYKYYVVSRHKTWFNARRRFRQMAYRGKIRKMGKWWMILQALPKKSQNGRLF